MSKTPSRLAARLLSNFVAVIAVTAIFGAKTHLDASAARAEADRQAARQSAVLAYEPYLIEQP